MSVRVVLHRRGGWWVDITTTLPIGERYRERWRTSAASRSAASRLGEIRQRHLAQRGRAPAPAASSES